MTVAPVNLAELRAIDLFDDLDDAQLEDFLAVAQVRIYEPGEVVAEQGEEVPGVVLQLEGTIATFPSIRAAPSAWGARRRRRGRWRSR